MMAKIIWEAETWKPLDGCEPPDPWEERLAEEEADCYMKEVEAVIRCQQIRPVVLRRGKQR
jgi:hypothetical protein